jgi:hypothetical protein
MIVKKVVIPAAGLEHGYATSKEGAVAQLGERHVRNV